MKNNSKLPIGICLWSKWRVCFSSVSPSQRYFPCSIPSSKGEWWRTSPSRPSPSCRGWATGTCLGRTTLSAPSSSSTCCVPWALDRTSRRPLASRPPALPASRAPASSRRPNKTPPRSATAAAYPTKNLSQLKSFEGGGRGHVVICIISLYRFWVKTEWWMKIWRKSPRHTCLA